MSLRRELIYIDGKDETDRIEKYWHQGDRCVIVFKNSNRQFSYSTDRARIVKTAVSDEKAYDVFNYLKEIADTVGLKTEKGNNILSTSYDRISHVPKNCILANFLNGTLPKQHNSEPTTAIFPFGFNLSQKEAVETAFGNRLSIIEGPPGTGKTQTILNIIANAVLNKKSVAVVSSNNSATKNVYEKLEKNNIAFVAALLGNAEKKREFIDSQKEVPDLSAFQLTKDQKAQIRAKANLLADHLADNLDKKNELALLRAQSENIATEFQHFQKSYPHHTFTKAYFRKNISSKKVLRLWLSIESSARRGKKIGWVRKLINRLQYGISDKSFYDYPVEEIITICQHMYYKTKITELNSRILFLENALKDFSFDEKMKDYTTWSMQLIKSELYERYGKTERQQYEEKELRSKSEQFIKDYPVIMSTTYSLRQSLSDNTLYDYVIIDEASQVDLATGALALSCAKCAVIVGDVKQLPNVVDTTMERKTDAIFAAYKLPAPYHYAKHSLLSALLKIIPAVPKTLLREHYRCHPKIIDFCNQKFYNNELIIHSNSISNRQPLLVYKTVAGNHARERMNQRQIDTIKEEIIRKEKLNDVDLGIVTPYRNQTFALQKAFEGTEIKADTVDKFQGRENEVIILSTVDNEISEFTDNPNRLNVAVSRAQEQLIVVVNGNESNKDSNINDLIQYIEYNNFAIIQSELNSIFDLLYKGYEEEREKSIKKSGKVSDFDSENLMYGLIKRVLSKEEFKKYDVVLHISLNKLIKDFSKLDEQEMKYAKNSLTHLDFLIYNKLGKVPVLAVEVDGFEFHKKGSRQGERDKMKDAILEKYGLPALRFKTNESNEEIRLLNKLNEIQRVEKVKYTNKKQE